MGNHYKGVKKELIDMSQNVIIAEKVLKSMHRLILVRFLIHLFFIIQCFVIHTHRCYLVMQSSSNYEEQQIIQVLAF